MGRGRKEKYGSSKWRRMNGAKEENRKKNVSQVVRMYKPEQIVITSL